MKVFISLAMLVMVFSANAILERGIKFPNKVQGISDADFDSHKKEFFNLTSRLSDFSKQNTPSNGYVNCSAGPVALFQFSHPAEVLRGTKASSPLYWLNDPVIPLDESEIKENLNGVETNNMLFSTNAIHIFTPKEKCQPLLDLGLQAYLKNGESLVKKEQYTVKHTDNELIKILKDRATTKYDTLSLYLGNTAIKKLRTENSGQWSDYSWSYSSVSESCNVNNCLGYILTFNSGFTGSDLGVTISLVLNEARLVTYTYAGDVLSQISRFKDGKMHGLTENLQTGMESKYCYQDGGLVGVGDDICPF